MRVRLRAGPLSVEDMIMSNEKRVAQDIYTYLYRAAFGNTKEEVDFRIGQGSKGVVNKVLDYIYNTYLKE